MFSDRYDHQTEEETRRFMRHTISPFRDCSKFRLPFLAAYVAFDDIRERGFYALLFLDQIKPIEQLVPVN